MKLPKEQQTGILKALMVDTYQIAKFNLATFGYLEHILIALTKTGLVISNLQWKNNIEKRSVVNNCINYIVHKGCLMYVFVGEAYVTRLKLNNLSSRLMQTLKQPKLKSCIVIYGATKAGEKLAVITPILKKTSDNEIKFGNSIWIDNQEVSTFWSDSNLFNRIFKKY